MSRFVPFGVLAIALIGGAGTAGAQQAVERERSPSRAVRTAAAHSHEERHRKLRDPGVHHHGRATLDRSRTADLRPSISEDHGDAQNPGGDRSRAEQKSGHEEGVQTENLFGFVLGSDTEEAGAKEVSSENVGRLGKRGGSYFGLGQKLEFSFGATDDLSLSFSLLGDYHRLRNVPGFDDVRGRYAFNGFGAEMRWRFLDRKTSPFGLTLHLEPSVARIDEVSGQAGRKLGSENKLIIDQELIPDTLFGALNILYDIERMKERKQNFVAERSATAGLGAALAFKVSDEVFLGGEARYLRAYDGFGLNKWQGHAFYLGPTLFARFLEKGWISAAWNVQVAGREAIDRAGQAQALAEYSQAVDAANAAGDPAPPVPNFGRRGPGDLVNFERHQFRLKVGYEF